MAKLREQFEKSNLEIKRLNDELENQLTKYQTENGTKELEWQTKDKIKTDAYEKLISELNKETCIQSFQKYLSVEEKIRSGVQIIKPGQSYKITISSRDFDLSNELRNKLKGYLDLLSTEDLFKIYTDQSLGAEARDIIKKRRDD